MRRLALVITALVAALALVPAASSAEHHTIVTATRGTFRISIVAVRGAANGGSPAATIYVRASRRVGTAWSSLGQVTVGKAGQWFWFPVTGPHALHDLHVDGTARKVSFRLLLTPSLGLSPVLRFHVAGAHLVRG